MRFGITFSRRIRSSRGLTLTELLIDATVLVVVSMMVGRLMNSTTSARNSMAAAAAAKKEKVAIAKMVKNHFRLRANNGVLRFNGNPYKVRFLRSTNGGATTSATEFETVCEDTSETRLSKIKLKEMPLPFCNGLSLPSCAFTNGRYVIRETTDPNTATTADESVKILPSSLAIATSSEEGFKRSPIAALLCVQSETAPTSDPFVVPNGNNLRVEIILGTRTGNDNVSWEKETLFLPVRAVTPGIRFLSSP